MISNEQILSYAREKGIHISPKMLRTWADKGLLPKAKLEKLGRGLGTIALYPDGSDKQAIAVYKLTRQTRDTEAIKWKLYEVGYQLDIKPYLNIALENHKRFVKEIQSDDFYESYPDLKNYDENYPTFVYLMAQFYTYPLENAAVIEEWKESDNRFFLEFLKDNLSGWKEEVDIYELASELKEYFDPENIEELFSGTDENLFRLVYRELSLTLEILWMQYRGLKLFWEGKVDKEKLGKGIERFDNVGRAWLMLLWLSLRNHPILSIYRQDLSIVINNIYSGGDNDARE